MRDVQFWQVFTKREQEEIVNMPTSIMIKEKE